MLEVMGCEQAISIWPHDNRGKYVHLSMVYVHTCYIFLKIWTWWIPTWRSGACRVYGFKLHVFGSLPVQQLLHLCLFWWVAGSPLFCVCCRNWFLIVCKFFVLVSFFLSFCLSFFLSVFPSVGHVFSRVFLRVLLLLFAACVFMLLSTTISCQKLPTCMDFIGSLWTYQTPSEDSIENLRG